MAGKPKSSKLAMCRFPSAEGLPKFQWLGAFFAPAPADPFNEPTPQKNLPFVGAGEAFVLAGVPKPKSLHHTLCRKCGVEVMANPGGP
jgi:hypothetical protein